MASELISTGARHTVLPSSYIRPECDRPRLTQVASDDNIPVIDIGNPDKSEVISQVAEACRSYGFFQVVNHGVPKELVEAMMEVAHEFFRLPDEEKMRLYSDDPAKTVRLSTSFNIKKETVRNWRDYLRLHCYPLDKYIKDWPSNPPSFRDLVSTYCKEVRKLGLRLQGLVSLSLGLEEDYIEKQLGEQEQHMALNYYPQCPEPELTFGLPAHTDPNAITILLQDQLVAGLQVLKEGKWIAVGPMPDAFVINLGDQLQALSNAKYKSIWHRAVVNSNIGRMSVASFLAPCNSALISPPEKLIGDGSPAVYQSFTYDEYYKSFWSGNLDREHCLELFKIPVSRVTTQEAPAVEITTEPPEIVKTVQEEWDKLEDKYAVTSLGAAGFLALWASSGMISAIDRLPLVPGVLELVGIGYNGWLAYRNLVYKPGR